MASITAFIDRGTVFTVDSLSVFETLLEEKKVFKNLSASSRELVLNEESVLVINR